MSVDHYVRLEQGRTLQFSEEVLDAVARALRLDATEREHLYRLARPYQGSADQGPGQGGLEAQRVRPGLQRLLDAAGTCRRTWSGWGPMSWDGTSWRRRC
ncbi:helix-turn-helix domain-containing protein [Catenulispora yoronensis]